MAGDARPEVLSVAADVLGEVRREKTEAKRSLRADVRHVVVRDSADRLAALAPALADLRDAGAIGVVELVEVDEPDEASVEVVLAPE